EESIIADLPLPDLPPEPPTELSDSFKELPPINSRQTNSSLGGIGDVINANPRLKQTLMMLYLNSSSKRHKLIPVKYWSINNV
ncbi:hypothetical protein QSH65_24840, partial [Escherichia coli]|uniref:hypothetical protein n=1 Tax=Escherichia coli TaxID=562 RepID=UPI0027381051